MQKAVRTQFNSVPFNVEVMFLKDFAIPVSMFKNDWPMIVCTIFDYMHKLES